MEREFMCGGDIHAWEVLMCGGIFTCGRCSYVEGICGWATKVKFFTP